MKNVGFTGTREGMTTEQRARVARMLSEAQVGGATHFHHGCAEGADTEAAKIAKGFGYEIVEYPAGDDPLKRNRAIVAASDWLIAAPAQMREVLRSGTWATIRYARKDKVPVSIAYRDGTFRSP